MSAELSYIGLKSANQAREAEEQRVDQRKKNVLILCYEYLRLSGYINTASLLESESNLTLSKYEVADNVDLETIIQEYESYYYVKFQKYPRIIRKAANNDDAKLDKTKKPQRSSTFTTFSRNNPLPLPNIHKEKLSDSERKVQSGLPKKSPPKEECSSPKSPQMSISGTASLQNGVKGQRKQVGQIIDYRALLKDAVFGDGQHESPNPNTMLHANGVQQPALNDAFTKKTQNDYQERLVKPVGALAGYNSELRELAVAISKDIYLHSPNVSFDDIIGLEAPKRLIKESVVYPIKYPQLFRGILTPWKGLLLYGPPGTGKTLLAKAVATECQTTFFNISASSIVSKWRGDSEKLVRVLFDLARFHAPSTIFLDELESVMSQRGESFGTEHEGSRRMKTELLVQMDGLARSDDLVFLLAASNLPWMLDHAMLRRLEKRILVGLPNLAARSAMFKKLLPPLLNEGASEGLKIKTHIDYEAVAVNSEGYSGADIHLVCKEAAMNKVRGIFDILESTGNGDALPSSFKIDSVSTDDVMTSLKKTKPSAKTLKDKYTAWQSEYEST